MQKHKKKFTDTEPSHTLSDIQHCVRLNDIDEIGDGTHYIDFKMLGLFSFNNMTVQNAVDFWMEFCTHIGVIPDTVTIHPDKSEWVELYSKYDVTVLFDEECIWSDGNIGGYCTEFYKDGIEIGNIVNTLGKHIDCGFGLERLENLSNSDQNYNSEHVLVRTINLLIESSILPSNTKHGYILRKLIRKSVIDGIKLPNNNVVEKEYKRIEKIRKDIPRWVRRNPDKDDTFFWDTYGISLEEMELFRKEKGQ